jgi:hypothetical protein
MGSMSDEQFDRFLAKAAREYRQPPPTPRDEIWARIQAARSEPKPVPVVKLERRGLPVRAWYAVALAAAVVLGVAIGRRSVDRSGSAARSVAAAPVDSAAERRMETVLRVAAVNHFTRVEALLTDYEHGTVDAEFAGSAKELLSRTRLLLDSKRMTDPRLRALLQDLELVLVQMTQVPSNSAEERRFIDEGINERHVRSRLRNAIPAGPTA